MFSIGEFSKLTGLTVKTLRYYHEEDLLIPSRVEAGSGYRYYEPSKIETARSITAMRDLGLSIADIKAVLQEHDDESTMLDLLRSRKAAIQSKIEADRKTLQLLDSIIAMEQTTAKQMSEASFEVTEITLEPQLIASVRHTGAYDECGKLFGQIGRRFGRHICGKPMLLCHDEEYREDANYEVAFPVRDGKSNDEILIQELPGGRAMSLMHLGPYENLCRSYAKLMQALCDVKLSFRVPSHEVYHKGPGILLKGNPQKYMTEIRLMIPDEH